MQTSMDRMAPRVFSLCQRCTTKLSIRPPFGASSWLTPRHFLCDWTVSFPRMSLPSASKHLQKVQVFHSSRRFASKYGQNLLSPSPHSRLFSSQSSKSSTSKFFMPWWQRLLVVAGFAGAGYYMYQTAEHEKELKGELVRYKEFEKAKLGGDWTLTDHNGNKMSSTAFRGQWLLIYFGFTHCPDICPEELEKLANLVKMIDEDSDLPNMQPLFISLDPERDTPGVVKDYLKGFKNPRMIGFTGTLDEIRVVAKKFRAYFGKGPADEDNDYIVDHTIIIYLINPEGQFVNYFDRSNSAETIKKTVTKHVQLYNEMQDKAKK